MRNVILATNNRGKITEIRALLSHLELNIYTPKDLGLTLDVPEGGLSYAENAAKKAVAFAKISGMVALGDDSGLEVEALDGRPGIHSHRFAPLPDATDADRRKYLLKQLADHPLPWKARFRATIAVSSPAGELRYATGQCEGEIIPDERGFNGFGYDPIFFLPKIGRTMAELSMSEKNTLSHRARAVQNAIPILKDVLGLK
jgi:XTP/dITP diphosphohydrolase